MIDVEDCKIYIEREGIRKVLSDMALPLVTQVTNSVYSEAMRMNPKDGTNGMRNDNYYHHSQIGRNGVARGDVELGNIVSMRQEKKHNYLLKALNNAKVS